MPLGGLAIVVVVYWLWPISDADARRRLREPESGRRVIAALDYAQSATGAGWTELTRPFLDDTRASVRRQAALVLAQRGDVSARRVLLAMLQTSTIHSPYAGILNASLSQGDRVDEGRTVATVAGRTLPSPARGVVLRVYLTNGATVATGERIADLRITDVDAREAIQALGQIGVIADLDEIRRWERLPEAAVAIQAIEGKRR